MTAIAAQFPDPTAGTWAERLRLMPALLGAAAPALLAVAMILTTGDVKVLFFVATITVGIVWAVVYWPEMLVIGYFLAGRFGFEDRLAPGALPFSANQVAMVAVLALLAIHHRHVIAVLRTWAAASMVLFTGLMTLGILWSRGPDYGTYKVLHTLLVVAPSAVVMLALIHRRRSLVPFLAALFALGMGLDLVGLATFETSLHVGRLTSLGSGPIVLARVVGASLLVAVIGGIHLLRRADRAWWETALGVLGLLSAMPLLAGFVLTQSRGPALALLLSLGIYAAISFASDWRRLVAIVALTVAALFAAEFVITEFARWDRFDMEHPANMVSLDGRREMARQSLEVILSAPILGVGTGGWPVAVYGLDMRTYPHNFFVEVAAEHGVVVAGLFATLFVGIVLRWLPAYRASRDEDARAGLVLTLVLYIYLLVNIQISGDLIDNRLIWILIGAMELSILFSARLHPEALPQTLLPSAASTHEEHHADATGDVGPPGP